MVATPQPKEKVKQVTRASRLSKQPERMVGVSPRLVAALEIQRAMAEPGAASPQAVLALQRLVGNRTVTQLLQAKKMEEKAPAKLSVQRQGQEEELQPKIQSQLGGAPQLPRPAPVGQQAIQRAIDPEAQRVLEFAAQKDNSYSDYVYLLTENDKIATSVQKEVIYLPGGLKKKEQGKEAQTMAERLDYVRAYLLKYFYRTALYYRKEKEFSLPKAIAQGKSAVQVLKNELLGFGLTKAGKISPELNYLLKESIPDAATGAEVDVGPRLEIRGTQIPGGDGLMKKILGKRHSFIVYTDALGNQQYAAGYGDAGSKEHYLKVVSGPFGPDVSPEWDPNASKKTLEEGNTAHQSWLKILQVATLISAMKIPYSMLSNNCNRVAYHLLAAAGVVNLQPAGSGYVGWGTMLGGDTLKQVYTRAKRYKARLRRGKSPE